MNDEEAVRVVLGIGRFTITNGYKGVSKVLNGRIKHLNKPIFNASEVLNENLSENKEAIKALEKEYKQNGVDFKTRELPDGKTELLFHAKDINICSSMFNTTMPLSFFCLFFVGKNLT